MGDLWWIGGESCSAEVMFANCDKCNYEKSKTKCCNKESIRLPGGVRDNVFVLLIGAKKWNGREMSINNSRLRSGTPKNKKLLYLDSIPSPCRGITVNRT